MPQGAKYFNTLKLNTTCNFFCSVSFIVFVYAPLLPMPMHIRVDIFQCKLLNKVGSSQNPETVLYRCSYDKRRSENMPQIYRRKAMRKYDLNILAKQLY